MKKIVGLFFVVVMFVVAVGVSPVAADGIVTAEIVKVLTQADLTSTWNIQVVFMGGEDIYGCPGNMLFFYGSDSAIFSTVMDARRERATIQVTYVTSEVSITSLNGYASCRIIGIEITTPAVTLLRAPVEVY